MEGELPKMYLKLQGSVKHFYIESVKAISRDKTIQNMLMEYRVQNKKKLSRSSYTL